MLKSRLAYSEASEQQLRSLNQFFADAGRASSVEGLQESYEHALRSIFGIQDATVRIFASPEEADSHELNHDPSSGFTKDVYGQTHSDLYHMVAVECRSRESARKMDCIANPNFGIFLENLMTNTENKLKSWIDKKSGLFTEAYVGEEEAEKRKNSAQALQDGYGAIYFDIDKFKQCNDTYGHSIGDEVIGYFGDVIRQNIRADDIAIRAGGSADEFVIFAYGCTPQDLVDMAKRVGGSLAEYQISGHEETRITASIGISHSYEATGLDELKDLAEQRMRHGKKSRGASVPPYMTAGYLKPHPAEEAA
jgi:diguanylate cyclase (GGDEF)-like protein